MDELCDTPLVVNEVAPSPCASGLPDEVLTTDCEGNLALRTVEACKARYDWELACLSDGVTTVPGVAVYDMFDPQNPVVTLYVGGVDVTATHTIVSCPSDDRELVETCFQDIADPSIRYTRVTVVDLSAGAVVTETFWLDGTGAIVAAPANVEPCATPNFTEHIVCDVVQATATGNIPYTLTAAEVQISYLPSIIVTGDTALYFWTDFGDGYHDVGNSPAHTYLLDGSYEIKSYVVLGSGNKVLLAAKEIEIIAGAAVIATANPQAVSRTFAVKAGSAVQAYVDSIPSGSPFSADGTPYVPLGTLQFSCPNLVDDLEDNAEWLGSSADIVECTATVGANVVSEATDTNLTAAGEIATSGGGTITTFHPALGNPALPMVGNTGGGALVAGLNVNVQTAILGAQFTYTLNITQDADPGDPADFAITVWDNTTGASIAATSIVTALPFFADLQGTGLNYPAYGYPNPIVNPYTIVWTGDLPVGDYTVLFLNQNQGITDILTVGIDHNIVAGGTEVTSRAELVALDPCTIEALTPVPAPEIIEIPNGATIVNAANLPVLAGTNLIRSFSVKGLGGATYDISFDGGTNWLLDIDGGDSWGEGNKNLLDITNVMIKPSLANTRAFIHWETV